MSQWRKFMFFEKDLLNIGDGSEVISGGVDEKESDKNLMVFSEGEGSITCCTSGRGKLYFGSSQGIIALVDRSQRKKTFEAHDKNVMFLKHVRSKNLLISIGNDEDITNASIKIWRLDNVDSSSTALPVHARTIKPFSSKFPEAPITCFTCLDDITQIVLGMGDGSIMLINGDLIRDRGRTTRLLQNRGPCVTNCFFVEVPGEERKNKEPENWLFVTTLSSVMTYYTSNLNDITMTVLDESTGCELNCATLAENRTLAVATPLAVFFFFHNERGGVYGFDDIKKSVYSFNNYLVLINEDRRMPGKNIVNIYDLGNQFIAYNGKFANVVGVISEWASIFIVTSSGFVFRLSEKDLHGKIEMLFKRNLFDIAINLAKSQNLASRDLAEIFKEYGDHLYGKGDYDRAVAQYIETIRDGKTFIEPSYVIRKFLDAQRIDNLTNYLEALHHNKCANKDHTTLLLNCFTKSKEIQKLDAFIKESTAAKFQDGQVPNFDVETAINVCRQAQYFEHALQLSQVHRKDEWHVKLLIEDMNKYAEAIDFLRSLDVLDAEQFVKKYGQELMLNQPGLTTELLKQICTDPRPSKIKSNERAEEVLIRARPEEFIHIYVERSDYLESFLEYVVEKVPESEQVIYNSLLELYLRNEDRSMKSPEAKSLEKNDSEYVGKNASPLPEMAHPNHEKIMNILQFHSGKYNEEHCLVLMRLYKFEEGILYLYKKMKLFNEILQHYIQRNRTDKILQLCEEYEEDDPTLWIQALSYFSACAEEHPEEIRKILIHIDANNLLPPLMVIKMLAKNPKTPLGTVKEYLLRKLQDEQSLIESHELAIDQFQEETEKMRADIKELTTSAKTFQSTKCSACRNSLDLPIVHFLCMHSFHVRCLQDSDDECPICAPEFRKVTEIKDNMQQSTGDHETFFKLLHKDGFSAVANFFGRGILFPPPSSPTTYQEY